MKMRNILFAGTTVAAMAIVAGAFGQTVSVVVNGNPITFPNQQPLMENDRVFVPLRGVFETLGAKVNWDPASQTVTAFRGRTKIQLTIGQNTASVDGQPVQLDVAAQVLQGSTMVPLRFVGEALGNNVKWDSANNTVIISGGGDYNIPNPPPPPPHHEWHPGPPPPPEVVYVPVPIEEFPHPVVIHRNAVLPFNIGVSFNLNLCQPGQVVHTPCPPSSGLPPNSHAEGTVTNVTIINNVRKVTINYNNIVTPGGARIPFKAHAEAAVPHNAPDRGGHGPQINVNVHIDNEFNVRPVKKGEHPPMPPHR
jgi:hypothetical protein